MLSITEEKAQVDALQSLVVATGSAHTSEEVRRNIVMLYFSKIVNNNMSGEISLANVKEVLLGDKQKALFLPVEAVALIRALTVGAEADEVASRLDVLEAVEEILDGLHLMEALRTIGVRMRFGADDDAGAICFEAQ